LSKPRMYHEFADLWTLISHPDDYAEEARYWRDALRSKMGEGRHRVLEMGVGGGNNMSHLTSDFDFTATDLSEEMLRQSRKLNPDVEHIVGDMRDLRLGKTFDAVIVHDAISYMTTEDDLLATFETAAAHLVKGGVFVTSPDFFEEWFIENSVSTNTTANDRTTLTHLEYQYRPDRNRPVYETIMIYLIREDGTVRVEEDRHRFGLFPLRTWMDLLDKAGFDAETVPYDVHEDNHESYLLVGVKR